MNRKSKIFLISLLFLVLVPLSVHAEPKLNMPKTLVEFEKPVFQGESIKGVFDIGNEGDTPLLIQKVEPG